MVNTLLFLTLVSVIMVIRFALRKKFKPYKPYPDIDEWQILRRYYLIFWRLEIGWQATSLSQANKICNLLQLEDDLRKRQ